MKSIKELDLDLESVEVRKKIVDFLMGVSVEFKRPELDSIDCRGEIIGYRNNTEMPDFSLLILAVRSDFPFGWQHLDELDTVIYGVDSETKKVFANIRDIQISDILADALVTFIKGSNQKQLKTSKIMRSISELGLDLENVEVRERVLYFLMGADVEFEYFGLDSTDCKGVIIGYRNRRGHPDFSRIILAVWDDFPAGWRQSDEFDTIILEGYSEMKKAFANIRDIQIPDMLVDTLVMFVKGKTISEPKVFNDWKVSKSYLSSSNGFKY